VSPNSFWYAGIHTSSKFPIADDPEPVIVTPALAGVARPAERVIAASTAPAFTTKPRFEDRDI
jgi:hypothetical protein